MATPEYITTVQASKIWNISSSRITILAKNGRINGAIQIGSRWMIPKGASKPIDGRTKTAKNSEQADNFRFPLFACKKEEGIYSSLTEEELRIKKAFEVFNACRFVEAEKVLGDLPEKASNIYIKIASLHIRCMLGVVLLKNDVFFESYGKLTDILTQEFAYKKEMEFFLKELDATLGLNTYFANNFAIDSTYHYHVSFLTHLATLPSLSLYYYDAKHFTHSDLNAHEINAMFIDREDSPVDSQSIHLYLGFAYSVIGDKAHATSHYAKALRLAKEHELIWLPVVGYYYGATMEDALKYMDKEFVNHIKQTAEMLHSRYAKMIEPGPSIPFYRLIAKNKYIYVVLAQKRYSNKDVARVLNVSENRVAKTYSMIYETLGINGKKELVDFYLKSISKQ